MSYNIYNAIINYEWMDLMWHIVQMDDLMCQIVWMNGWYDI
jgi:hypothetical protein